MQIKKSAFIILFIASVFVTLQSPFAPFANKFASVDIGVYIYCAKQIINGNLMYKDIFDHKGPAIYLYNMLGLNLLNGNLLGLWILEVLFLYISSIFLLTASALVASGSVALIAVIYSLLLSSSLLDNGGHVREVALPFMSLSLYLYTRALLSDLQLKKHEIALIAFCCTATFLLLPNMITIWIGFSIVILYRSLSRKDYKNAGEYLLIFALTSTVTLLPFIAYAIHKNILSDALFCIWDFNRAYSNTSLLSLFKGVCYAVINLDKGYVSVFVLSYLIYLYFKRKDLEHAQTHIAICVSLLLTVIVGCSLPGRNDPAYYIICVPLICIIAAYMLNLFQKHTNLACKFIFIIVMIFSWRLFSTHSKYALAAYKTNTNMFEAIKTVKSNSNANDNIAILGNSSQLYYLSERNSMSKLHFTYPVFDVAKYGNSLLLDYCEEIRASRPKLVIVETEFYNFLPDCINESLADRYKLLDAHNLSYVFYKRIDHQHISPYKP